MTVHSDVALHGGPFDGYYLHLHDNLIDVVHTHWADGGKAFVSYGPADVTCALHPVTLSHVTNDFVCVHARNGVSAVYQRHASVAAKCYRFVSFYTL